MRTEVTTYIDFFKNTIIPVLLSIFLCLFITACDNDDNAKPSPINHIEKSNVFDFLTQEKKNVLSLFENAYDLNLNGVESNDVTEKIHLTHKLIYNDIPIDVYIEFFNNKVIGVYYAFDKESKASFEFAKEVYNIMTERFGKCDTDHDPSKIIQGLTFENYMANHIGDYEEWWQDSGIPINELVSNEHKDFMTFDLGIKLTHYQVEDQTKSTVFVGARKRITNHKLWSAHNSKYD